MADQLKLNIGGVVDIKAGDTSGAAQAVNAITQGLQTAQQAAESVSKSLQLTGASEGAQRAVQGIQSYVRASKAALEGTRMFGAEIRSVSAALRDQAVTARRTAEATQRAAQSSRHAFRQLASAIAHSDTYAKDYLQQVQTTMAARLAGVWAALRYARQASTAMEQLDILRASLTRMQGQMVANDLMEKGTEIAYKYGASVIDTTKAITELTRQGRSAGDIKYLTEAMAQTRLLLATSTGELVPMARMIEHVTVLMNQLNISAREAARGLALMAELDIRTASSLDKIGTAIAKFAATGKLARMTLDEIILAATAFTEVGFTGEQAGTALNTILSRVGRNTEALAFMRQFGVSLTTVRDGAYVANSSLNMLVETYTKLKEAGRYMDMRKFLEMFSGTRMQSRLVAGLEAYIRQTAPDTGTYTQIIEQMAQNDAIAQQKRIDAMNVMLDTIGVKRIELQNAFNEMFVTSEFISFYKAALDALSDVAKTFATIVTVATRGLVGFLGFGDVEKGLQTLASLLQMYLLIKIPATITGGIKYVTAQSVEALSRWATKIDENLRGIRYDDSAQWGEGIETITKNLGGRLTEAHNELTKLTTSFTRLPAVVQGAEYSLHSLWTGSAQALDQYAASIRATSIQMDELVVKAQTQPRMQASGSPMHLLATFSPQEMGEMTPESAKKWLQDYALAIRNEMRTLKATLAATPMFDDMSKDYQARFEEASRHIERVFDRTYARIRRAAGKETAFDPLILKEQANEAFQQLMKADSMVKTIPLSWDVDMAKAETAKMMHILEGEIKTFSTLFGQDLEGTVSSVIANKITSQIKTAEKAFGDAEKQIEQLFAKSTDGMVDPSALQRAIMHAVEPIQAAAETIGTNMSAMLSQHVIPSLKREVGEVETLLEGLRQKVMSPGIRRSPMADIFAEQVTLLESNKIKAEELILTMQKLPRNADPAVLTQKMHSLMNIIQQCKNEAALLDSQMSLSMRAIAARVVEVGASLLKWVNIAGMVVSAISLVVHWVNRIRDAWIDARIEAEKFKVIAEDISEVEQRVTEASRDVSQVHSDFSGGLTQAEDSLNDLLRNIDVVADGLLEASKAELDIPGAVTKISDNMINAGVLWYEILKDQAGLIEGNFDKMDQVFVEAVEKWNDSVLGADLQDAGTVQKLVADFMQDILKIPPDLVKAMQMAESPLISGPMDRFAASILSMAVQAQKGADVLGQLVVATSQSVVALGDTEQELVESFRSLETPQTTEIISSALDAFTGVEGAAEAFDAATEKMAREWAVIANYTGITAPPPELMLRDYLQGILKANEGDAGVRATIARGLEKLLAYLATQEKTAAELLLVLDAFPESVRKQLFIETMGEYKKEGVGSTASAKGITNLINTLRSAFQLGASQETEAAKAAAASAASDATSSGELVEIGRILKRGEALNQRLEDEQIENNQLQIENNNIADKAFKMSVSLTKDMNDLLKQTRDQMAHMREEAKKSGVDVYASSEYRQLQQQAQSLQNAISGARVTPTATGRTDRDAIRQVKDEFEAQKAAIDAYFTYREDSLGRIIDLQDRTKTPEAFTTHLANLEEYVLKLESLSTRGTSAFQAQVAKELEKANLERKKTIKMLEDAKLDIINEESLTRIALLNLRLQETGTLLADASKTEIFGELAALNLGVVLNQLQQAGSSTETYAAVAGLIDRLSSSEQEATLSAGERANLYAQMARTVEELLTTEAAAVDMLNPRVISLLKELRQMLGASASDFQGLADKKADIALRVVLDTQHATDQLENWLLQKEIRMTFDGHLDASGIGNRLEAIRTDMNTLIQQVIADNRVNSESSELSMQATLGQLSEIISASLNREISLQQAAIDSGIVPTLSSRQIAQVSADRLDPAAIQELVKYYMQSAIDQLHAAGVTAEQIETLDTTGLEDTIRTQLLEMIMQFIDSLRRAHDELLETIRSAWEEGFNIGFEHGFSPEGWSALRDSLTRRIGSTISGYLSQYLSEVIADGIAEAFASMGGMAGSLGGMLGGLMGGIVGEIVGFFIGGLFNQIRDQAESMADQQRRAQKDQVTSSGFNWSYREAERATPYYEFSPPVTQESVKIVKFVNNFSITTDAAVAMISHQRELERVVTEIVNNLNRTLAKTTGLVL